MYIENHIKKLRNLGYFKKCDDRGEYYSVICPFHNNGMERTPSMGINKERIRVKNGYIDAGHVHCFGCGYKARFSKFLADIYGVSEMEILKLEHKDKIYNPTRKLALKLKARDEKKFIFEPIGLSERARKYLLDRGISDYVIDMFGLQGNEYEVVFPLRDKSGNVVAIQKRNINKKFFFNTEEFDKLSYMYALYELKKSKYVDRECVYIVESIIDALTLWSWGYKAVALMGSEFSEYHFKELFKLKYEIVVVMDNDEVGKKATQNILKVCKERGLKASGFCWNNCLKKDINELNKTNFEKRARNK